MAELRRCDWPARRKDVLQAVIEQMGLLGVAELRLDARYEALAGLCGGRRAWVPAKHVGSELKALEVDGALILKREGDALLVQVTSPAAWRVSSLCSESDWRRRLDALRSVNGTGQERFSAAAFHHNEPTLREALASGQLEDARESFDESAAGRLAKVLASGGCSFSGGDDSRVRKNSRVRNFHTESVVISGDEKSPMFTRSSCANSKSAAQPAPSRARARCNCNLEIGIENLQLASAAQADRDELEKIKVGLDSGVERVALAAARLVVTVRDWDDGRIERPKGDGGKWTNRWRHKDSKGVMVATMLEAIESGCFGGGATQDIWERFGGLALDTIRLKKVGTLHFNQ